MKPATNPLASARPRLMAAGFAPSIQSRWPYGGTGSLALVVKKGNLRFVEARMRGDIVTTAPDDSQALTWEEIEKIDMRISSLCSYTEASGGEARLILEIDSGNLDNMEMVLCEELCPSR